MENTTMPRGRTKGIIINISGDELLIYDTETNRAYCLNSTSALIWRHCDGETKIEDFVRSSDVNRELVVLAIDGLQKNDLLAESVETQVPVERVERRKFMFKAGAMAIALPVISTIIAPSSASAQSCYGTGTYSGASLPAPTNSVSGSACGNYCIDNICCNGGGGSFGSSNAFSCNCNITGCA